MCITVYHCGLTKSARLDATVGLHWRRKRNFHMTPAYRRISLSHGYRGPDSPAEPHFRFVARRTGIYHLLEGNLHDTYVSINIYIYICKLRKAFLGSPANWCSLEIRHGSAKWMDMGATSHGQAQLRMGGRS